MNYKPGDMAVYVGLDERVLGRIVRCVSLCERAARFFSEPFWVVDPPLPDDEGKGFAWSVADRSLRPIRDPGEDARDETLEWLSVPSRTKEAV